MNKDIVPELLEKMLSYFNDCIEENTKIQKFYLDVSKERAKQSDVFYYSKELGNIAAKTILNYIKKENLPNGILYWNIAERTITPIFNNVHELVNKYFIIVNTYEDKRKGIGIKTIPSSFPEERVRDLINKYVESFNGISK